MAPEIMEGEDIIIKKSEDYEIGDIITFSCNDEIITHRIVSIENNNLYYTKGDLNNTIDLEPIEKDKIYGKVIYHFKGLIPTRYYSSSKYVDSKTFHIYGEIEDSID